MRSKVGRLVLSLLILFALNFGPRGVVAEGENGSDGESKPSTPEEEGEKVQIAHEYVGINSLVFVAIVVACLFIGRILKKRQIYWMPQSSASMLVGFLVGIVLSFFGEEEISYIAFEPNVFFFIILPAIIFDAGYSLKKVRDTILSFSPHLYPHD